MERAQDSDDLLPELGLADVLQQRPMGIVSPWHAVRVALAVTVSWVVAISLSKSTYGIFAPVTTLLVVQQSAWSTLGISVQRVLGAGIGVLVASVWVNLVGLTWWSFLLGTLAALLIARLLPWSLGGQLQIPVTVVFVLALGPGTLGQDLWRVLDVAIGGAIGLAAVFVYQPRPRPAPFEAALRSYRDAIVSNLRDVGRESGTLDRPLGPGELHSFVGPSRRIRELAEKARTEFVRLAESAQLNPRAGDTRSVLEDDGARLRRMNGIAVQVRGIVGAAHRLYDREGVDPDLEPIRLRLLIDHLADLMDVVLGGPGSDVRGSDRDRADRLDAELADELRDVADAIAGGQHGVGGVLESVSLLGRLDHVRVQLTTFPGWIDSEGQD